MKILTSSLPAVATFGQYVRFIQTLYMAELFFDPRKEALPNLSINPCRPLRFSSGERKRLDKESVSYVASPVCTC